MQVVRRRPSARTDEQDRAQTGLRGPQTSVLMKKTSLIALVVVAGLIVSGGFFLLTWDIPPPSAPVERVLPDERFPR